MPQEYTVKELALFSLMKQRLWDNSVQIYEVCCRKKKIPFSVFMMNRKTNSKLTSQGRE